MADYWLSDPLWRDLAQLQRGMDDLFARAGGRGVSRAGAFPAVNLYESGDAYVLTAELPGLSGSDIDVSVEHNRVTLRGERRIEHPADASLHRVERQPGILRRTIELPAAVDGEKAEATYRNGVLLVRIPKSESQKPRRIAVKG